MTESKKVLIEEMRKLEADILREYERSGKKVTGEFARGLMTSVKSTQTSTIATLSGYTYLAGRARGKMPPIAPILEWVKRKGIFSFQSEQEASGIAWAIAKKISREGTTEKYHLKIYEKVITPQRIQQILDNVVSINIKEFVDVIQFELRLLTKNL